MGLRGTNHTKGKASIHRWGINVLCCQHHHKDWLFHRRNKITNHGGEGSFDLHQEFISRHLLCITHNRTMTSHRVTKAMVLKPVPHYMVVIVTCILISSIRKTHTTQRKIGRAHV